MRDPGHDSFSYPASGQQGSIFTGDKIRWIPDEQCRERQGGEGTEAIWDAAVGIPAMRTGRMGKNLELSARWEHFPHEADMGIRGIGTTKSQAFEQAALALMAVITDPQKIAPQLERHLSCEAPDDELLLVDWLNMLIYEMACGRMVFGRFHVTIDDHHLTAIAHGERVDRVKHDPAVEIKGATYTELSVRYIEGSGWVAQCVVDV